jgi:O-antigen biosynthesis protein WbqV
MPRQLVAFLHDILMAAASFVIALMLRLGEEAVPRLVEKLWPAMVVFTVVCAGVFLFTGLYRGMWRYASLNDLTGIVKAVTIALLGFLLITFMLTRLEAVPRTSLVINWFVLIFLLGAPRMLYRIFKDRSLGHILERDTHLRVPVLLIGAGDAAEVFIREMARDRHGAYEVLGVVDEKGTRVGRRIHDVPVLGHLDKLTEVLETLSKRDRMPQRLIMTKNLEREDMETLLDVGDEVGATIARLPRLTEFSGGEGQRLEIRPVAIEDLLGRTQTKLDRGAMKRLIAGRRVLVTGAGGSIGSELVRQIAAFEPAHLALMDNAELNLYTIDMEIGENHAALPRRAFLGDVRERGRLDQVFASERPELVFHAAALKHVPLMEANPIEAVLTNVIGTRNVADACRKAGVAAMVQISTDKAINPQNVMGATKRLAESYCQALDILEQGQDAMGIGGTRFITVRFGNVLGSTGSVVPLFQRQLKAGGPLTVTDASMTRYFMTIREAVELVLQASAIGQDADRAEAGKIFVLDMGEPVKILDLAHQMIRLAGLRPDKDIEITFTGLRPGEKLHEELFHEAEPLLPTGHPSLKLANPRTADFELLSRGIDELGEVARGRQREEVCSMLQRLVPEYLGLKESPRGSAAAAS